MKQNKDYTGELFHSLTILRQHQDPPFKRARAECRCSCGKIVNTELSKLLNGHTKSCGCIRRGKPNLKLRKEYGYSAFKRVLDTYKGNARKRNFDFLLQEEEARSLFEGVCHYCGAAPNRLKKARGGYGEFYFNGIDRLDNDKPYTKENSVSCCTPCNYIKNKMHFNDFINWIRKANDYTSKYKYI